jgi:MFS family permease
VTGQFAWYLGTQASWFTSFGVQTIVFPWLVAVALREPAQRVGIAQTAMMAPAIAFMLLGGTVADRGDCRALLVRYHVLAAGPPLILAIVAVSGVLSYPVLIGYALTAGTLGAFVVPTRDALLTRVVSRERERAIAVTSAVQFLCQMVGILAAGWTSAVGAAPLLVGQGLLLALGALAALRLLPAPSRPESRRDESRLRAMQDGVREAWASERVFPILVGMLAVGVLYGGSFAVILPLVVRDVYGGSSSELALVNVCFWAGTIGATLAQIRLGALQRPGRAVLVAMACGALILAAMAVPGPLWRFAALCGVWGVGAGVVLTQGRTIVQLGTRESHRARALAIFQLGFTGGAPLGALALGYVVAVVGPRAAVVFPAATMTIVLAVLLSRSRLWGHDAVASETPA